jgi:hypothetical protein
MDRYGFEAIDRSEFRFARSGYQIDAAVQISLLGKLKLAIRARPHLRAGFLIRCASEPLHQMHGSEGVASPAPCFAPVVSGTPAVEAMHSRRV